MYILCFLMILFAVIWFLPFVVHIGVKVYHFYFETELVISVFGQRLYRRKWQGDWFDRVLNRWKESLNEQTEADKKEHEDVRGIVPRLLQAGRWRKFVWLAELGLDDAMVTAVMAGGMWALQGVVWARWIHDKKCVTVISCRPNFEEMILKNELICIVRFRSGDIIKEFIQGYLKRRNAA